MARTDAISVQQRFDTDLSGGDLQPFIDDANALVTSELADEGLEATLLKRIETYIAAHFAAVRDPRFTDVGGAARDATFEERGSEGPGLAGTQHGRRAIDLDPTNTLAPDEYDSGGDDFVFTA